MSQALYQHLRDITEMVVNDSAASQLLAADMGRGRRQAPPLHSLERGAFTPNVKIVGRDLAHCARRILSKPWQADAFLESRFEDAIWNKRSITQIIWNSDVFSQWFEEYVEATSKTDGCPRVRNLRAAKHRLESSAKPLARFILHLKAPSSARMRACAGVCVSACVCVCVCVCL